MATSLVMLLLSFVFEDELFTKSDVKKILVEQNIRLENDFKILSNKSTGWNDFVHIFEIQISNEDKNIVINKIKSADDFKLEITDEIYLPELATDRYYGDTLRANYQCNDYFISSTYYPNGPNIKPTYKSIKVYKNNTTLRFEEILD